MASQKAGLDVDGRELAIVLSYLRDSDELVELQSEAKPLPLVLAEVQVRGRVSSREINQAWRVCPPSHSRRISPLRHSAI